MPTLVLLRHGQSQWNLENRFTGWWDVDLSPAGVIEARNAGKLLRARGFDFDCCFTSVLTRAIRTLHLVLHEMDQLWLPVAKDWRLNERHYGGLTGLNKQEMIEKVGAEQVKIWRRSYDIPPPPLPDDSPYKVSGDRRYAGVEVPRTESLKDTIARCPPLLSVRRRAGASGRQARDHRGARQFAARHHQISVEHRRRGNRGPGNSDGGADRLRADRRSVGRSALFLVRNLLRPRPCAGTFPRRRGPSLLPRSRCHRSFRRRSPR